MPRRQFMADLATARTSGTLPPGISQVKPGDDDGHVDFTFTGADGAAVHITAYVPELSAYPLSHEYMLFCGQDTPQDVSNAIEDVRGKDRKTVFELLDIVSTALSRAKLDRDGDSQMQDSQQDEEFDDGWDDIYGSDHEAFDDMSMPSNHPAFAPHGPLTAESQLSNRAFRQRIRSDLRVAKEAGFKVGHLGFLLEGGNSFVTVSIRVAKLGISEEAMQAWQVEPSDYLTLVIHYPNGYTTNEALQGSKSHDLASSVCMRVVVCKRYKPTLQEAIKAFSSVRKDRPATKEQDNDATPQSSIRDTFISKPLAKMLQERLVPILRFRGEGMDWLGAEGWYEKMSSAGAAHRNKDPPAKYFEPEGVNDSLPDIVNADHYRDRNVKQYSFPLLAMQYMLRHFVRCTDFCLVCHRKLDVNFEAIKPYVCDRGLCLFQLLSLGFGPSIEHEVTAQPYVVDLLVSFCYNSAAARKLKTFPDGLGLMVPPINTATYNVTDPMTAYRRSHRQPVPPTTTTSEKEFPSYQVGFDQTKRELIFENPPPGGCPVRRGNWILLTCDAQKGKDLHCRVSETSFFPTISIDEPVVIKQQRDTEIQPGGAPPQTPAATRPVSPVVPDTTPHWVPATFQVYEQNFAELSHDGKCVAICRLLDTLPSVTAMREYLAARHPADLSNWTERVQPHALSLLRWIVASNRSCIMQVDGDRAAPSSVSNASLSKEQERCFGMKGQMQFRFAMGAPDKEQRFVTAVRDTTARLSLQYPTLFAWHGSPLANWHMIIREGLNFNSADHGRAYGDGVYHSQQASTSSGYSQMYTQYGVAADHQGTWPSSVLNISSAMALNEVVNAPKEFQSSTPHLVIQQLDWIQTRYLFVQVAPSVETLKIPDVEVKPENAHVQDPSRTPQGMSGEHIVIPAAAIKTKKSAAALSGSESQKENVRPLKKLKLAFGGKGGKSNPVVLDDNDLDTMSVATDVDDLEILSDEPEPAQTTLVRSKPADKEKSITQDSQTDFVPGTLDFSKLPVMPEPTYAQSTTTKRLMNELRSLQKVQSSTPMVELGWYIDIEKIENVYQWIVELHSFHVFEDKGKKLPLSEDMKKRKITSIVLEVNFNKDYPFTPPYVRVIRPRFMPFNNGGGGHIVIGGAMCMELLTNTGWSSVSSMESVLMQVRLAIASEPYARLDIPGAGGDYNTMEAADGYLRACQAHGWAIPPGFKEMAYSNKGK